jgi:hypothetical protein
VAVNAGLQTSCTVMKGETKIPCKQGMLREGLLNNISRLYQQRKKLHAYLDNFFKI